MRLGGAASCGAGQAAHLPALYLHTEVLPHAVPAQRGHPAAGYRGISMVVGLISFMTSISLMSAISFMSSISLMSS